jgi:glyoxylase-like metal-dependent hydrolase (beta-lactamase superfamily II)
MTLHRRAFLGRSVTCACHLALAAAAMPAAARRVWAAEPLGQVVAREPFGTLEKIADGVWAVISQPLNGDRTTLANGGLIAGKNAVLAVEGFNAPAGAEWLAARSVELTGLRPTHVVLTHHHGDHANGVSGFQAGGAPCAVHSTAVTRDIVVGRDAKAAGAPPARAAALGGAVLLSHTDVTTIDLGGRAVKVVPRGGHTQSDVTVELDDPSIVFCGDLVWNAMFPNYVDTTPSKFVDAVHGLKRAKDTLYVPGHGPLAKARELDRYIAVLNEVEAGARKSFKAGIGAEDAGRTFMLSESLGPWALFSNVFYPRAFDAWYRELKV